MEFITPTTVLDLRSEPAEPKKALVEDPCQETQILPGERLKKLKVEGDWVYVEAVEQPYYDGRWSGYKGWVQQAQLTPFKFSGEGVIIADHNTQLEGKTLSMGSKMAILGESEVSYKTALGEIEKSKCRKINERVLNPRTTILQDASSFIGMPYQWGGRSSHLPNDYLVSSVDCSGLVSLAYLLAGKIIPRNAHDQWLKARPLQPSQLQAGDLIFTAKASRLERVTHVMLFKDSNTLIEASSDCGNVREISINEKLGAPLDALSNGIQLESKIIFFGTLL